MQNVDIRKITLADINQLQTISGQTFTETFSENNTEDNMKQYLENQLSIPKLTAELENQYSDFYFAQLGDKVVGYLKINHGQSQTELKDSHALEIERIYVLKEHQGSGVGQVLYEKAMQVARQSNADYIWLGVWEKNPRAIQFYKKNGFVEFDKHIFQLGNDNQTDIMMKLKVA